jgi:hypothetical protein
VEIGDTEINYY